jgi:hypothetical protein
LCKYYVLGHLGGGSLGGKAKGIELGVLDVTADELRGSGAELHGHAAFILEGKNKNN